jgi:hypothetical protein
VLKVRKLVSGHVHVTNEEHASTFGRYLCESLLMLCKSIAIFAVL